MKMGKEININTKTMPTKNGEERKGESTENKNDTDMMWK